jgi:hypothetical protein
MEPTDNIFLQILTEIVQKYNLTIQHLDLDRKYVELDGSDKDLSNAAIELEEKLGNYCD